MNFSPEHKQAEAVYAAARGFVPRISALAPRMQAERRVDAQLLDDMEQAGLFSLLVGKRWGGAGLGPHEANKVTEIIGSADCSTGWVTAFYILHNWFLCKFPLQVQEKLYQGRNCVRAPAVFGPPGTAEPINYLDIHAQPQRVDNATLPWSYDVTTTDPAVFVNVMAQGDSDSLGCRIIIDGAVKDERTVHKVNAYTFCLDKSG